MKPRFLTDVSSVRDGSRLKSRSVSLMARRCFVPSQTNCVLPVLRESRFEDIHSWIESIARRTRDANSKELAGKQWLYSCIKVSTKAKCFDKSGYILMCRGHIKPVLILIPEERHRESWMEVSGGCHVNDAMLLRTHWKACKYLIIIIWHDLIWIEVWLYLFTCVERFCLMLLFDICNHACLNSFFAVILCLSL